MKSFRASLALRMALGVLALLTRMGLLVLHIPNFGASYPQALPAILAGLVMSSQYFDAMPGVSAQIAKLKPNEVWIGVAAITTGVVSLLFGCVLCVYY